MRRYRCVDDQRAAGFAVTRACDTMQVSTSAYYACAAKRDEELSPREERNVQVLEAIREIHDEHPDWVAAG